ncbi:hypothetical protein ACG7TL_002859 [Trametes sanguinea]
MIFYKALLVLFAIATAAVANPMPHVPVEEVDCDAEDIMKRNDAGLALCL